MLIVLLGAGGVGKGTMARRLVADEPGLVLSRSWTTRSRRPGEDESSYRFVDRARFEAHLAAGGFLEHDEFLGNLYGTPVPERDGEADDLVLEINVAGAEQVRALDPEAVVILVVPPDRATQRARLQGRGDDDEHIERRLAIAAEEEAVGRRLAAAVVVNDHLERAVAEVAGIVHARRAGQVS